MSEPTPKDLSALEIAIQTDLEQQKREEAIESAKQRRTRCYALADPVWLANRANKSAKENTP